MICPGSDLFEQYNPSVGGRGHPCPACLWATFESLVVISIVWIAALRLILVPLAIRLHRKIT